MAHRSTPIRTAARPRFARALLALSALAAGATQAAPVSVSIGGLPPGLAPTVIVQRNVCPDGVGWVTNPTLTLTEQTSTTIERVVLPSGQTTIRSKLVTRYVGSFDTPATPSQSPIAFEVQCSRVALSEDLFRFSLRVPGTNALGGAAALTQDLGVTLQNASITINRTLAAKTTDVTVLNQPQATLARGMIHTVTAAMSTSLGTLTAPTLDFLRPSSLFPGAFSRVARLFVRADGAACVQAGTTTRCLGETALPEAGGVMLRGLQAPAGSLGQARFQFELAQGFPVGTLKLRASADATDLAHYLVDGTPQTLDLLPWQSQDEDLTVQ